MPSQDPSTVKIPADPVPRACIEQLIATVWILGPQILPILREAYPTKRGRPPYPILSMFIILLLRTFWSPSYRELKRKLDHDRPLLALVGLPECPPHQTMSNHFIRIGPERVQRASELVVKELQKYWPDFGQVLSLDGTFEQAYAKNNRGIRSTVDPDARWGYKQHNSSGTPELGFGFRNTRVDEARYEVPVTSITTPANANESPLFPALIKKTYNLLKRFRDHFPIDVVVADAQYDSRLNIEVTIGYHARPVIQLNPRSSEFAKLTGTRKWDVILPTKRNSDEWNRYMRMRNASERINNSLHNHVGLDTLKTRTLIRVTTYNNLCILAKQLMALSAARLGLDDLSTENSPVRSVRMWSN